MENQKMEIVKHQQNNGDVVFSFFNPQQFDTMQRVCKMFASSELVPEMYKVSADNPLEKAMANCMIAVEMAQRIGASPLMIMQNMVIIYGRPSWSSKFLIATVNTCGRFNPLQFRFTNLGKVGKITITDYEWSQEKKKKIPVSKTIDGGNIDNIQCVAFTSPYGSDTVLESSPVSIELAIQEGWYYKNGSKWQTMTRQMLMYRAASFWTSAYAPELSMGMKTDDEIRDIEDVLAEDVTEKVSQKIANEGNKQTIDMPVKQTVTPTAEGAKAATKEPVKQMNIPKIDF